MHASVSHAASLAVLSIAILMATATRARADVTIENKTNDVVHVALGFSDTTQDQTFGTFHSSTWTQGWYDVEPQSTRTIKTTSTPRFYYAASSSQKWLGEQNMYIKPGPCPPFNIKHPVTDQAARSNGWEARGFRKIQGNRVTLAGPGTKINVTFTNGALVAVDYALNTSGTFGKTNRLAAGKQTSWNLTIADGVNPSVQIKQLSGPPQNYSLDLRDRRYRFKQENNKIVNAYD